MDEVVEALEKYQGLVPLVYDIEIMGLVEARPQDMQYAVYLKREADKVIAHHKYKRCVELANSCAIRAVVAKMENRRFPTPKNSWRMFIYPKWHKRWLKIAEKFKEAK